MEIQGCAAGNQEFGAAGRLDLIAAVAAARYGMSALSGESLFLLTDLYELTMACGYWKSGRADREAVFHLVFRKNPFGGGFSIACGLTQVLEFLTEFQLSSDDRAYLETLKGNDGEPLFSREFLDYLSAMRLRCDVDAVPEGTVVFPQEPLVRVKGPLLEAQVLETALLNIINFQTLIATKAARLSMAARGRRTLEFGLRRAQGMNGGLAASRAAYVGGCDATSNVLAGKLYDIPVAGTHAHSWVMSFDSEQEAFDTYAEVMPNNSIFLVDTYDTADGIERAIETARGMRARGREPMGIRLDSGDLGRLSVEARRRLDEAGFPEAKIVASGDLDEHSVAALVEAGAPIDIFGVGTKLATAFDEPALGGVYKLSAISDERGRRLPKLKTSNDPAKTSNPGCLQIRRFLQGGRFVGDVIYDEGTPPGVKASREPADGFEDLLVPVLRGGEAVYEPPAAEQARLRTLEQLAALPEKVKRFERPEAYPVELEKTLAARKEEMIGKIRESRTGGFLHRR